MCQRCCRRFEIFAQQDYRSPGSSETGRKHISFKLTLQQHIPYSLNEDEFAEAYGECPVACKVVLSTYKPSEESFFMSMKSPFWLSRTFLTLHFLACILWHKACYTSYI
jgi:hypothetical protein